MGGMGSATARHGSARVGTVATDDGRGVGAERRPESLGNPVSRGLRGYGAVWGWWRGVRGWTCRGFAELPTFATHSMIQDPSSMPARARTTTGESRGSCSCSRACSCSGSRSARSRACCSRSRRAQRATRHVGLTPKAQRGGSRAWGPRRRRQPPIMRPMAWSCPVRCRSAPGESRPWAPASRRRSRRRTTASSAA